MKMLAAGLAALLVSSLPAVGQDITITPADTGKPTVLYRSSHALVIAIDGYSGGWPKLHEAANDAAAVAEALKKQGFSVTLRTDKDTKLDKRAIEGLIDDFVYSAGIQEDARLLFWFAGHGHTIDGEGYIVPQDAPNPFAGPIERRPLAEADFRRSALSLRRFGEYMKETKARHVLAVFDSCFGGTVFDTTRAATDAQITQLSLSKARQFLSSGDAGQEVSDDGLFRKLFIEAIGGGDPEADENHDGFVSATELGRYLTYKVTSYKGTIQTPRYGKMREFGMDRGEFIFRAAMPKMAEKTDAGAGRSDGPDQTIAVPQIPFATRGAALPVYFLTDRERSNDQSRVGFSNKRSTTFTLGKALVRVAVAEEGAASLDGMSVLEQDEFVSGFPAELARVDKFRNQALIFVHGYNISFDNAFYRTAQIASDIGFDGPSIVYSWPSSGSVSGYLSDREAAAVASANFAKFVEWLALRTPLERIHVIAHNMGGAVLLGALENWAHASDYVKAKIGDLVFVAPDVDRERFASTVSEAKGIGRSVTLYVTSNDRALRVASLIGASTRAGEVSAVGPFIDPGVDTIDISALDTELFASQHSGRAKGNTVLSDISLLLQGVRPPDKRLPNLRPATTPSGTYWKWQP